MKSKEMKNEDYDKIHIGEMTSSQFATMLRQARTREFSLYAKFCMAFQGYDLLNEGKDIQKWEAFYISGKDPEKILAGQSKIKAVKRLASQCP